jgi:transcription initiation factor IIE alpha subunit
MDDNEKAKLVIKIIIDSDTKVLESEFIAKAADLSIQEVNRIINILAENGVIKTIKALDSISNGKIGI